MSSAAGVPDSAFALASAFLWAIASVLFTAEGRSARPAVMNAFKSSAASVCFAVVLLLGPAAPWGNGNGPLLPPSPHTAALALSGVIGIALGDTCYFESLARIGVRRTMMIGLLAPVFTAVAAAAMGQPLPAAAGFAGIALTLGGILLVIRVAPLRETARDSNGASPVALGASPAGLGASVAGLGGARSVSAHAGTRFLGVWGFGILAALCQAIGIVLTKDAMYHSAVLPASLLRLVAGGLGIIAFEVLRGRGAGLFSGVVSSFRRPRLVLATLLGTVIGFFFFQTAILLGSPPVTAALCATSPLLAAPIAARFLDERMPWPAALGTLVAVAGVVLIVIA